MRLKMSQLEQFDLDEEWLYGRLAGRKVNPSTHQVDAFCDRVWELISTKGLPVQEARSTAIQEIFGKR